MTRVHGRQSKMPSPLLLPSQTCASAAALGSNRNTVAPVRFGKQEMLENPQQSDRFRSCTWSNLRMLFRSGLPQISCGGVLRKQCNVADSATQIGAGLAARGMRLWGDWSDQKKCELVFCDQIPSLQDSLLGDWRLARAPFH